MVAFESWRFVFVQQEAAQAAQTLLEFPPMREGSIFNMTAIKEQPQKAAAAHTGE